MKQIILIPEMWQSCLSKRLCSCRIFWVDRVFFYSLVWEMVWKLSKNKKRTKKTPNNAASIWRLSVKRAILDLLKFVQCKIMTLEMPNTQHRNSFIPSMCIHNSAFKAQLYSAKPQNKTLNFKVKSIVVLINHVCMHIYACEDFRTICWNWK